MSGMSPPRWFPGWSHLFLLAIVLVGARLLLLAPLGLNDDEAYYWAWSHMPSLSYFDNSPGAGWFLIPFTGLFGDHVLTLRVVTALVGIAMALAITQAVCRLYPQLRSDQLQDVLWLSSLSGVVILPSMVWTPDALLLLFASLAFAHLFVAIEESRPSSWLFAGLFLGLALLSKANAALYIAIIGFWVLLYGKTRVQLRTPWPWLAFALILLALLPIVLWNAWNDWAFVQFQGGHIFLPGGTPTPSGSSGEIELSYTEPLFLVLACLLFAGPAAITAVQVVWSEIRQGQLSMRMHLVVTIVLFTSALFLLISIYKGFAANWAILSVLIIFIVGIGELVQKGRPWLWSQAAMVVLYVGLFLALSHIPSTVGVAKNWRSGLVWDQIYQIMRDQQDKLGKDVILAALRYQDAAQLAFRERERWSDLPGDHLVPGLHLSGRSSQFAYAFPDQSYRGQDMLIISNSGPATPKRYFCKLRIIGRYEVSYLGQVVREFNLYYGKGFFGRPDVVGEEAGCPG